MKNDAENQNPKIVSANAEEKTTEPVVITCPECQGRYLEGYKHVCPKWVRKSKGRFHPKKPSWP